LVGFLYVATWPFHNGLNNPNEMVRVYMTKAMVDDGTTAIDSVVRTWGGVDDKATRDGKLYSSKAPLQSLIGVPVYAVHRVVSDNPSKRDITTALRWFASALPGLLIAALLIAWARRRTAELDVAPLGTGLGLALALGTMLYPYALTFTGHILAALTAGGTYLAAVGLSRAPTGERRWVWMGLAIGFAGGAAPFAEYPCALIAAPAIVCALVTTPSGFRAKLFGLLAVGGAAPFGLGLWAHYLQWGSPVKTGYAFLENKSYVEVHADGFFGVTLPKADAFFGSLFSSGTGLFFFSPIMIAGLIAMVAVVFQRRAPKEIDGGATDTTAAADTTAATDDTHGSSPTGETYEVDATEDAVGTDATEDAVGTDATDVGARAPETESRVQRGLGRPLAIAGLFGFVASVLFISGHTGWRGGWTVGPRYIIAVAPVLGIWAVEATRIGWLRPLLAPLGAASILATGFAAALYPHLSDVYTNPLATFLWPSYRAGETTYGIAHSLGLHGGAANAAHVVPLIAALLFAGLVASVGSWARRIGAFVGVVGAFVLLVAFIPEMNADAASAENARLWGFWEPAKPRPRPPGMLFSAYDRWRTAKVEAQLGDRKVPCRWSSDRCDYGGMPWQHYGPEVLAFDGSNERVLFVHPIKDWTVRIRYQIPALGRRLILRYGLTDASVGSDNPEPVKIRLFHGDKLLKRFDTPLTAGLQALELELGTIRAPVVLELDSARDGARVVGFDVEVYE